MDNLANSAVDEIKKAMSSEGVQINNAGIDTTSGAYGLDMVGAASVLRVNTPFIDELLPVLDAGGTGLAAQYWSINAKNGRMAGSFGSTGDGQRGGVMSMNAVLGGATYKTAAVDGRITDEARLIEQGIVDGLAMNTQAALVELKRIHNVQCLYGRTTTASDAYAPGGIGSTGSVTASVSATGGAIAAGTYSVIAVALGGMAYYRTRGYAPGSYTFAANAGSELLDSTRTNGDQTTSLVKGGTAIKSAAASTGAITGSTNKINASITPVVGALGYAWFVGVAGSEVYQGTTGVAHVSLSALQSGTQAAAGNFTADNSADALDHDGLITRMQMPDSGSRIVTLTNGSGLTPTTGGSIAEFEALFNAVYQDFDGYSYEYILTNGKGKRAIINALTDDSVKASRMTYMVQVQPGQSFESAADATPVRNVLTGTSLPVYVDPYLPDGVILFGTKSIPSQFGGSISAPVAFRTRQNYKAEVWPRRSRVWENTVSINGSVITPWRAGFGALLNVEV